MPRQTIQTVEGGDLIAFRQRRVVEDRIDKIIDLSMKGHDGLADVDQFCGSFADSMNTEQMPGVPVKQQFEYTGFVTDQLSPGDFLITCDADSIGHLCLFELFLVPTHYGDFRNGIDAVGKERGVGTVWMAEGVAGGVATLLH